MALWLAAALWGTATGEIATWGAATWETAERAPVASGCLLAGSGFGRAAGAVGEGAAESGGGGGSTEAVVVTAAGLLGTPALWR